MLAEGSTLLACQTTRQHRPQYAHWACNSGPYPDPWGLGKDIRELEVYEDEDSAILLRVKDAGPDGEPPRPEPIASSKARRCWYNARGYIGFGVWGLVSGSKFLKGGYTGFYRGVV